MKFVRAHGWYRHITLVLAAQTSLVVLRHQTEPAIHQPTPLYL
ncbi:hypothetical protein [Chroococcidiopsis cubana]|nr:hypothetical protein [Chroococcidiopsis cubana]